MVTKRQEALIQKIGETGLDAVVLVPGPNMTYFTGLVLKQSERLQLAIARPTGEWAYIVPQVELGKVKAAVDGPLFWYTDEQGPQKALAEAAAAFGPLKKIGIEYGSMRVLELKALERVGMVEMEDAAGLLDLFRMYKDEREIEQLQKAVDIVEQSLEATLPFIRAGVAELEVAARLEYEMRKRGSEGTPFGTIVASGYRGALPHGRASAKLIEDGELVVLDFGSIFGGYVADITRTVAVGAVSAACRRVYQTVLEAQQAAIAQVRPGVTAHDVDEAARSVIRAKGYDAYFTHRTGHGIGLGAHEAPYMMQGNFLQLQKGMAFTVEPGIYVPDCCGVRIEDNVIVTDDGSLNLMRFSKEFIQL